MELGTTQIRKDGVHVVMHTYYLHILYLLLLRTFKQRNKQLQ